VKYVLSFLFSFFPVHESKEVKAGAKGKETLEGEKASRVPPEFYLGVHDFGSWLCTRNG